MKEYFLFRFAVLLSLLSLLLGGIGEVFAQKQTFEVPFQIVNFPQEFLPGWYANEVRSTPSRVFQSAGTGLADTKSLAVQPISSFNGAIWIKVNPDQFEQPAAIFYARSTRNGTGTRPAQIFCSWGKSLVDTYSEPVQIGSNAEFANENQEYRRFILTVPEVLKEDAELFLRLDIRYGPGTGSAARWMMDDFQFGDFFPDLTPPIVQEVRGFGPSSVLVSFNEPVDPVFSILPLAYTLDGENPETVEKKADSAVILKMARKLDVGKSLSLDIRQIPDLEGNFLRDTTLRFTFLDPTDIPLKALVINELMPAPRADLDLPNSEFIEVFHTGDYAVRLEGVRLSNSRSETILNDYWLKPGDYLILAPAGQASQFTQFGEVLAVENWPTLLNSADRISLKSTSGFSVDQISYGTSSWGGGDFASGGFSLEVSNPFYGCDNSDGLVPSVDLMRGTPGRENSVFTLEQTTSPLSILGTFFQDSMKVIVAFSQPVFSAYNPGSVAFFPGLEVDSVFFANESELIIVLQSPAKEGELYRLELEGIQDCWGKVLPRFTVSDLILPSKPMQGDVILNELLFDPKSGDPKFVELRNVSKNYLNLEDWSLANLNPSGQVEQVRVFGSRGLILAPDAYLAITPDANRLKLSYPKSASGSFSQVSSLPSYPISGGTVVLISAEGAIHETFAYNKDLHHPLLRDSKGVSLERISALSPASLPANWQSASGNEEYATPGRKNSQSIERELSQNRIQIEPEVFDPEGSTGTPFTTIRYQLDQSGWVGTFQLYSAGGQLVQVLAQNQLLGTTGLFTWTGTDSSGKQVRAGYYVLVVELYEAGGRTHTIKRTLVVATRL